MNTNKVALPAAELIINDVRAALREDLGDACDVDVHGSTCKYGTDLSASVIARTQRCSAQLITREHAVLCGAPWFESAMHEMDSKKISFVWTASDGDAIKCGQSICKINGNARAVLSAERTALNFLQLLSGVATVTRRYVEVLAGSGCQVLDTRKTIPGLRHAQKYAVRVGGGHNHRFGLYDAVLLKENHVRAAGGIATSLAAVNKRYAKTIKKIDAEKSTHDDVPAPAFIAAEVETLEELASALRAGATRILLDNFGIAELREAVRQTAGRALLEASGNITLSSAREVAASGVDFISIGALTKNIQAVDYSLLFDFEV